MSFYLFRRYLLSSRANSLIRVVSWICLGGVTISIAALILIISIMGGFGEAIKSRLLSKEAHLVVHFKDNPFTKDKKHIEKKSVFLNKEKQLGIFSSLTQKQRAGIKEVLVFEKQDLILKSPDGFKGVSAIGYSQKKWDEKASQAYSFSEENSVPGKAVPFKPVIQKEALISSELSLNTKLFSGDELILIPLAGILLPPSLLPPIKGFVVKGILPQSSTPTEDFLIYYKQGLMDFGDFSKIKYGAEVKLYDPEKVLIYKNLLKGHKVQTWRERNSLLFFALKLEKFVMTLFLVLSLVISCLGISSALFLLMAQKAKDLAIFHAMGLSQKDIVKVFTRVGLYLTFIGLFSGALIGYCGTLFLKYNTLINFLPEMYQDRTLPAVFLPFSYFVILLSSLFLAWVSCYLPTRHLSHIKPSELLKITGF